MSLIKSYIVPHPPMIIPEVGRGDEKQIIDTIESKTVVDKEMLKTAILVGLDKNEEENTEDTVDIILKNLKKILD